MLDHRITVRGANRLTAPVVFALATIASDAGAQDREFDRPILVTAQRRVEPITQVPVSVVALSGEELERRNAQGMLDLQRLVPNITLAPAQNVGEAAGNVFIRGIGQEDFALGSDAGVAVYLDGVYLGRSIGILRDFLDIDRVEVLRGPQGTLYGRNAIGGALNLVSNIPRPGLEGKAVSRIGSWGRFSQQAVANVELKSGLSARIAAVHARKGGFVLRRPGRLPTSQGIENDRRPEGAGRAWSGRLQFHWDLSPAVDAGLFIDGSRTRGTQGATHVDAIEPSGGTLPTVNRLIEVGLLSGPVIGPGLVMPNLRETNAGGGNRLAIDEGGVAFHLGVEVGDHRFKLTAAQRWLRSLIVSDLDGTDLNLFSTAFRDAYRQSSIELQADGPLAQGRYVAGIVTFHDFGETMPSAGAGTNVLVECGCFDDPASPPPLFFPARAVRSTSHGVYAQVDMPLTRQLTATAGGRWSQDRKSVDASLQILDPSTFRPVDMLASGRNRGQWDAVTWRAALEHELPGEGLAYVSASRGYRSGGFNVRPVANLANLGLAGFAPEYATTLEAGLRAPLAAGKASFYATLFTTRYRDMQLRQQTIVGPVTTTLIGNAAKAVIRGVEIEVVARPTPNLSLALLYGHLDPRYVDVGQVPGISRASELPRTARHSFSVQVDFTRTIRGWDIGVHADFGFRSKEQFQLTASPFDQRAYGLLGARLNFVAPGNRYSFAIFGTNLTDVAYRTAGRADQLSATGFAHSKVGLPRTLSAEITARF